MRITESKSDGLRREFKAVIAAADINQRVATRLKAIGRSLRLPGFQPGKVPITILKQRYGSAVIGEILEGAVNEICNEALRAQNFRLALQPKVEITAFSEDADFEFKLTVEVLPDLIQRLKARGYRFITCSDMARERGVITTGGPQVLPPTSPPTAPRRMP